MDADLVTTLAALVSFFVLVVGWVALPNSAEPETALSAQPAPAAGRA